jgi:hypothetical protein
MPTNPAQVLSGAGSPLNQVNAPGGTAYIDVAASVIYGKPETANYGTGGWAALSFSGGGGSTTLAGDVVGPTGANTIKNGVVLNGSEGATSLDNANRLAQDLSGNIIFGWGDSGNLNLGENAGLSNADNNWNIFPDGSMSGLNLDGLTGYDLSSTGPNNGTDGSGLSLGGITSDLGSTGAGASGLKVDGQVTFLSLPSADPHIAGQVWSNLGILTVSAG